MKKSAEENDQSLQSFSAAGEQQLQKAPGYYAGIDWISLIFRLLEKVHWILLAALVGAAAMMVYVRVGVTPIYQATSKLYIAGSETSISLADLQLGSTLAKDYQEVFKIWHIHEMVAEKLELPYGYGRLGGMVSVRVPDGSHVLYIYTRSSDPTEAQQLADTYAEVVSDFIANKMELRKPQLLEKAQWPSAPISPNVRSMIMTGFIGGGFAAAALVVVLFLLDDKIRTSEDIEKASGLPVLGMISRQTPEKNAKKENQKKGESPPPAAVPEPVIRTKQTAIFRGNCELDYTASEAVNTICSSITFAGKKFRKIAVTSGEAGNGKSFVALRIAQEMARRGKRTLLIDADLRKSVLVVKYNIELPGEKYGLAHYLSGQCRLENAVYQTNIPNFSFIPVGRNVKTPLPLLSSDDFAQMLDKLSANYDYILIDTPPIGIVIDSAEIARKCDGSLLVLEYNVSTIRSLRDIQKQVEQTGKPILGCVINKIVLKGLRKKRYYYHYGNYGAYEYSNENKKESKNRLSFHLPKDSKKT